MKRTIYDCWNCRHSNSDNPYGIDHCEVHATLSAVLDDLQQYENIFQCHRSFVVNLNNITSAQGNSNGYQLKLGKAPTTVPVSRTYVPKLRSFIA